MADETVPTPPGEHSSPIVFNGLTNSPVERPSEGIQVVTLEPIETKYGQIVTELHTPEVIREQQFFLEQEDRAKYGQENKVVILGETDEEGKAKVLTLREMVDGGYYLMAIKLNGIPNLYRNKTLHVVLKEDGAQGSYSTFLFQPGEVNRYSFGEAWEHEGENIRGRKINGIAIKGENVDKVSVGIGGDN